MYAFKEEQKRRQNTPTQYQLYHNVVGEEHREEDTRKLRHQIQIVLRWLDMMALVFMSTLVMR